MKTNSTPVLQFSGYPLTSAESSTEKTDLLQTIPIEKKSKLFVAVTTTPQHDTPAHWDESWFANYE